MHWTKEGHKKFNKALYDSFILGGDIGGTNSRLGVFGLKNVFPELLVSFACKSTEIRDFHGAINEVLSLAKEEHNLTITKACFGVAGVVSPDRKSAEIRKLGCSLSSKSLVKKTSLKQAIFINDFQAIGYGINMVKKSQLAVIKKGSKAPRSNILVIGAGTGLGKSLLIFDENKKFYQPIASEGGHTDFPAQTAEEIKIVEFIKKHMNIRSVPYERMLSGPGLGNIYLYLKKSGRFRQNRYTKEIDKSSYNPQMISKYRKLDKACRSAFEIFKEAYAKFARNMALDGLSLGGVYIAGGIAPKNIDIFDSRFVKAFEHGSDMPHILKKMPVYIILDDNIGLLGAGFAGARMLR